MPGRGIPCCTNPKKSSWLSLVLLIKGEVGVGAAAPPSLSSHSSSVSSPPVSRLPLFPSHFQPFLLHSFSAHFLSIITSGSFVIMWLCRKVNVLTLMNMCYWKESGLWLPCGHVDRVMHPMLIYPIYNTFYLIFTKRLLHISQILYIFSPITFSSVVLVLKDSVEHSLYLGLKSCTMIIRSELKFF